MLSARHFTNTQPTHVQTSLLECQAEGKQETLCPHLRSFGEKSHAAAVTQYAEENIVSWFDTPKTK